jgi:hypothetical protein
MPWRPGRPLYPSGTPSSALHIRIPTHPSSVQLRKISNRHFVRLEIEISSAKSTRSLFLIVTKQSLYLKTPSVNLRTVSRLGRGRARYPGCRLDLPSLNATSTPITATAASLADSTTPLFLIVPNRPHFRAPWDSQPGCGEHPAFSDHAHRPNF